MRRGIIYSILFILSLSFVTAATGPIPIGVLNFDFSNTSLPDGDWQLNFIPIPDYGVNSKDTLKIFNQINAQYLQIKELCGVPSYLQLGYNLTQEERDYLTKTKYLVEVHGSLGSTFLESKEYEKCWIGTGYGSYNSNFSKILEKKYKITTNYWVYTYGALQDLRKENKNIQGSYGDYCEITNRKCPQILFKGQELKERPYFLVLEKMNSTEQIYFSGPVNINWGAMEKTDKISNEYYRHPLPVYNLFIEDLKILENNNLSISFSNASSNIVYPKDYTLLFTISKKLVLVILFSLIICILIKKKGISNKKRDTINKRFYNSLIYLLILLIAFFILYFYDGYALFNNLILISLFIILLLPPIQFIWYVDLFRKLKVNRNNSLLVFFILIQITVFLTWLFSLRSILSLFRY